MNNDIQLSNNFWLSELAKSRTADRLNIDNWPYDPSVVNNLKAVTINILQSARDYYGIPFAPNSGYRSLMLNRYLNSKDTSQHVKGEAVDFEVPGIRTLDLATWIMNTLDYDQLILEMVRNGDPRSGWVHCSFSSRYNRRQVLSIHRGGRVYQGLVLQ